MIILGLDPGGNGAFVTLDSRGKIKDAYVFSGENKEEMFLNYVDKLKAINKPDVAYIEHIHAIHGSSAKGTFSFGRNYQIAIDGLLLVGVKIKYVQPRVWQKEMFTGATQYIKKGTKNKRDNKKIAMEVGLKLFNEKHFLKSSRSKKPHDGLIDAALIATYGYRKELNDNTKG